MDRIVVVGAGVVGLATGDGFATHGLDVSFVDISETRVRELRRGGRNASTSIELDSRDSAIFLVLPTPNVGNAWDLGAIEAASRSVGNALRDAPGHHTVIVRSTTPPGTADGVVRPILEECSGQRLGDGYRLASNPEFLRAVSAHDDFLNPWMTVVGSPDTATRKALRRLYEPFGGEFRAFEDYRSAELIKCAHNLFNATKISFWNEMWRVAEHIGIDADEVAETVAISAEGSFSPSYGIRGGTPYGGACLPKDTRGFLGFGAVTGLDLPLLAATIQVNEMLGEPEPGNVPVPEITAPVLRASVAA